MTEPDPFEGITDYQPPTADDPHVVVVTGRAGKKPYANVMGPFPSKASAASYAANLRKRARKHGVTEQYGLSIHVRPLEAPPAWS